MKHLVQRALDVYRDQGPVTAASKSIRYATRAAVHFLGKKWLYRQGLYRSFSTWWNAGLGKYTVLADPLEIYWINPHEITYITGRGPNPGRFQWQQLGTICGGDWDKSNKRFVDLDLYQGLYDRYHNGLSWKKIDFVQQIRKQADSGTADWKGIQSETDLWKACRRVDDLYESINKNGYRTMDELVDLGVVDPEAHRLPEQLVRRDEIVVDIDRDGQFLFVDGRHRLAIAKILGLEEIPVRISARHERWQRVRERVADADDPEELPENTPSRLEHPDLTELVEDN